MSATKKAVNLLKCVYRYVDKKSALNKETNYPQKIIGINSIEIEGRFSNEGSNTNTSNSASLNSIESDNNSVLISSASNFLF